MTVFQLFRLWARRAPFAERLTALVGAVLVVSVMGWLLVPASDSKSTKVATSGLGAPSAGETPSQVAGADGGSTTTVASGGLPNGAGGRPGGAAGGAGSGTVGATIGNTGGGCVSPPGSDQGVTATQLRVAVVLINLAGGVSNSAVGYAEVSEQRQNFEQVIADINASGGVACRQLVATFYSPNVIDQAAVQQTCLEIIESKAFAVLDSGALGNYPAIAACLPKAGIPIFTAIGVPMKTVRSYYPYFFTFTVQDVVYHNTVFALKQLGFFDPAKGFKKLGISYKDCQPEFITQYEAWLQQVGVPSSQIVKFNTGCSSSQTPPHVVEQAVLTFKTQGVTHVSFLNDQGTYYTFTEIAEQQDFRPKYGFGNNTEVSQGSPARNWDNLDGAIAINANREAEENTPGLTRTAGTQRCDAVYAKHNRPTVWEQSASVGVAPGLACNLVWMFAAAAGHAPVMQRNAVAAGLKAAKSVDFSWSNGPNDFTGDRVTAGGQFWRVVQASASCKCWRVIDPTFHPSFPGFQ